jgi:hypothetical protein
MFKGRELLRIGKRSDRAARERRECAAQPTDQQRLARLEALNDELKRMRPRKR